MQERVFTVKELNSELKKVLDMFFSNILLEGEVSSVKPHSSGNIYLNLKDQDAVIDAVIFKNYLKPEYRELKEGAKVLVRGAVSLFIKGGKYSFSIKDLQIKGKGNLYEEFLKLKEKLEKAGLFDESIKKAIPAFPKKIGIVTASDGAAVKDILSVALRRFDGIDFVIFPAQVQGEGAVESIILAIQAANVMKNVEALIIGRGGGSYEELSVFNDEKLAYAILESKIPTISAVGHEKDFTISDFVADRRAATPSQAAEMLVPDKRELGGVIENYMKRMEKNSQHRMDYARLELKQFSAETLENLVLQRINSYSEEIDYSKDKLDQKITEKITKKTNDLKLFFQSLEKLNPLYLLNKNYSILYNSHGKMEKSIENLEIGDEISTRLTDGWIFSRIIHKKPLNKTEK